jgi:transcriptional antiterminator NusG
MEEKQWYVVNTYSGHENKVKEKLDMRIQSMNMQDYIFRVIVPEKTEIEIKD